MRPTCTPRRARPCRPRTLGRLAIGVVLAVLGWSSPSAAAPKRSAPGETAPAATPPAPSSAPSTAPSTPPTDTEPPADDTPSADAGEPAEDAPTPQTPAETPAEAPAGPTPTAGPPAGIDRAALDALNAESRALQDELFKARARVAVVTSKLFRAKITLQLRSNLERFYDVSDLVISIDGAPVFSQEKGWPTAASELFEVYAAPGAHELGISAHLVARRDATYKLRIDDTFTVFVPEDSTVSTRLQLRETGNMWRFTKRGRGRHVLTAILRARAKPNERRRGRIKAKTGPSAPTSRVTAPARAGGRG